MLLEVIACLHWHAGQCAAGHHGGRPSAGRCMRRAFADCAGATLAGKTVEVKSETVSYLAAIPRAQWPIAARTIARMARAGEQGVGSTVERLAGTLGIGPAYRALWKSLGSTCGCDRRRETLDARYPYA